jgi:hypothetical protein
MMNHRMTSRILTVIVAIVLFSAGAASAQWLEWSAWHVATTGRVFDQNGQRMGFTMTSLLNFDSGMCVIVLRDTSTGQFSMIEAPGTGNCNE